MNQAINHYLKQFATDIQTNIQNPGDLSGRIILTVAVLFMWVFAKRGAATFWFWAVRRKKVANRLMATTRFLFGLITLLAIVRIWLSVDDSILILLGLAGGLVFLSGKELITNVVGWVFIITHHPFRIGDRIEVDGMVGQVIQTNWQTFAMVELATWFESEAPTGRIVKIPNHLILEQTIKNYSDASHFVWKEIRYRFTYASDWEAAYAIMDGIVGQYVTTFKESFDEREETTFKNQQLATGGQANHTMMVDADEAGISLKVRYPVRYEDSTSTKTHLQQQLLAAFKANNAIEPIGEYLHVVANHQ